MTTMNCPNCPRIVDVPEGFMQWAGHCECGRSVFDAVQEDTDFDHQADATADEFHLRDTAEGLELTTPNGAWLLDDAQAAHLAGFLSSAVADRLYRRRELRRPVSQTDELASIADHHN